MSSKDSMLGDCLSTGCGWKCCSYGAQGILMLPKEYEQIKEGKAKHLEMVDNDYLGGKIVKCIAKDTSNCDNGYKPIQCSAYPFWVRSTDENAEVENSKRCPMSKKAMSKHKDDAVKLIKDYGEKVEIKDFLKQAKVNNYEKH